MTSIHCVLIIILYLYNISGFNNDEINTKKDYVLNETKYNDFQNKLRKSILGKRLN